MVKKRITKRERNQIIGIMLGISAYAFIAGPIQEFILKTGISSFWQIIIGIGILVGVYKLLDLA